MNAIQNKQQNEMIHGTQAIIGKQNIMNIARQEKTIYMKSFKTIAAFLFSVAAIFWIFQAFDHYYTYPVNTTTTFSKNVTFPWPSITICTFQNSRNECHDKKKLKKYNASDYEWGTSNYFKVMSEVQYKKYTDVLKKCTFKRAGIEGDCMNKSSIYGSWTSYRAQNETCHTFSPVQAVEKDDELMLVLTHRTCRALIGAIHEDGEIFQYEDSIDFTRFLLQLQEKYLYKVIGAKEIQKVNRVPSPCEEDPFYSQSTCLNQKKMEYLIKYAECNIPEITGYKIFQDYPACNDLISIERFEKKRKHLNFNAFLGVHPDFEEKDEVCKPRCNKFLYKLDKEPFNGHARVRESKINLTMDPHVMPYQRVEETLAVTPDMMVSFVGGTVGIFLGYSVISLVDLTVGFYKKLRKFF